MSNEDSDCFNINLKIRTHESTKHAQKTVYYESQFLKNDVAAIMSGLIELSSISTNICTLGPQLVAAWACLRKGGLAGGRMSLGMVLEVSKDSCHLLSLLPISGLRCESPVFSV